MRVATSGMCTFTGCGKTDRLRKGLCGSHYARLRRNGDPSVVLRVRHDGTPLERIQQKVTVDASGCWFWDARSLDHNGYGIFWIDGRHRTAHRVVYELTVGPVPDGLELDHTCRVRHCVNPEHLEVVTHLENVQRGEAGFRNARKTHCPHGHEFTTENTYTPPRGGRVCRECTRIKVRESQRRRRGYQGNPPNADKTHCRHGHEFTLDNTIVRNGHRECRECGRERARAYQQRKRASST